MKRRTKIKKGRKAGRSKTAETKRPHDLVGELYRAIKKPVTLRLDADVLAWFKKQGPGYQTRINQALRKLMVAGREESGE